MNTSPEGATIEGVTHHHATVNGGKIHYVSAGTDGPPILLVHGFPESWWAFHAVIPHLAASHRVFAVDLRGFGDSDPAGETTGSAEAAEDLSDLIEALDLGPVHLLVQDISGPTGFRLAAAHPDKVLSLTAVESGISGFGLEALADVTHGGAWYIGALAIPGVPEAFFRGREAELLGEFLFPAATVVKDAVGPDDIAELARGYTRPEGWTGARALYGSLLKEGDDLKTLAESAPLKLPVLAVDHKGSDFTYQSFSAVHEGEIKHSTIDGVGHYIALEAPKQLADAIIEFVD